MLTDITAIIKAFERPDCLFRLLRSIRTYYPDLRVLIADDSRRLPVIDPSFNVTVYKLPHDSGISVGRNHLVDRVTTPLFLLLDDDYIFTRHTVISSLEHALNAGEFDIMAGKVNDTQLGCFCTGMITIRKGLAKVKPLPDDVTQPMIREFVPNFFLARTDRIKRHRWNDKLKIAEHVDFFARAKDCLKIGYLPAVSVDHDRGQRSPYYRKMRSRVSEFRNSAGVKTGTSAITALRNVVERRTILVRNTLRR